MSKESEKEVEKVSISSYWRLEEQVAHSFNRLKAQVFNLIEASVMGEKQQEAMKGLVRGFASDELRNCSSDMRYTARAIGVLSGDGESSYPRLDDYSDTPK